MKVTRTIRMKDQTESVEAEDLEIEGLRCFLHKNLDTPSCKWSVSEFKTGLNICYGRTKKEAIEQATERLKYHGKEATNQATEDSVGRLGCANL